MFVTQSAVSKLLLAITTKQHGRVQAPSYTRKYTMFLLPCQNEQVNWQVY